MEIDRKVPHAHVFEKDRYKYIRRTYAVNKIYSH